MPLETSYTAQSAGSSSSTAQQAPSGPESYWSLEKCREAYNSYLFNKREEIDEQIDARRYYHGAQWTAEQMTVMKRRKQPVMTFNRVARKIDGVVGLVERLRQDPKAYARTPQHEEGADLATACVRYVLDQQEWKAKSPLCGQDGAVDGIGGIELEIGKGDKGDAEIEFEIVDVQSFFYDPRSYKHDFSDARYMGIGKWLDLDIAREMFPDAPEDAFQAENELVNNTDRENRWFRSDGITKRVRIVDVWYKHKGGWCWSIFSGNSKLMEGKSYLKDEKGKDLCKYMMFSGNVDHDGDRYGFIRNLKSPQDGINARQSKMQHILASNRIIVSQGAVSDIEKTRAEWAKPDGVIITNRPVNEGVKTDDRSFDFAGWTKLLELNLAEIENFGPNPALIGQGVESKSGRAIALLQQAGMAELGPFILAFRGWKIRVYRAIWNAIQQHWTAERWIRVTDSEDLAQYVQINALQNGPMGPQLVNAVGSLDVDIIMDEGPDSMTMMEDTYNAILGLAQNGAQVPPDVIIDLSPNIDARTKKSIKQRIQQQAEQPNPEQQKMEMQMQMEQAKLQMQGQAKQQEMVMKQQDMEMTAQLDQAKAANEIQLNREKTQAQIELEREKVMAQLELKRLEAEAQLQLQAQTAEQDAGIQVFKAKHEADIKKASTQMEFDLQDKRDQREDKRESKKMEGEHKQMKAESKSSDHNGAAMAAALTAVAHAIEKSSGSRKISKGKDGSYKSEPA